MLFIEELNDMPQNNSSYQMIRKSSHRSCTIKKVFLKISKNSRENICARDSFSANAVGLRPETY